MTIQPTRLALLISLIYGVTTPRPVTPVRWYGCPECAEHRGPRMTICRTCGGSGKVAYL